MVIGIICFVVFILFCLLLTIAGLLRVPRNEDEKNGDNDGSKPAL